MVKEQVNNPLSNEVRLETLMVCSILISAKHPVEQFQLNSLSVGGVGVTKHVRLRSDPMRYSIVLLFSYEGIPGGLATILT